MRVGSRVGQIDHRVTGVVSRMDEMTDKTLRNLNAQETPEERARLAQIRENLRNRLANILGNPLELGATSKERRTET